MGRPPFRRAAAIIAATLLVAACGDDDTTTTADDTVVEQTTSAEMADDHSHDSGHEAYGRRKDRHDDRELFVRHGPSI